MESQAGTLLWGLANTSCNVAQLLGLNQRTGSQHAHRRKHALGSSYQPTTCSVRVTNQCTYTLSSRPSPRSTDGSYTHTHTHVRITNLSCFPMVILILQHLDIYTKAAKIASKALQHVITDHTELLWGDGSRATWGILFGTFALLQKGKRSISSRTEGWFVDCLSAFTCHGKSNRPLPPVLQFPPCSATPLVPPSCPFYIAHLPPGQEATHDRANSELAIHSLASWPPKLGICRLSLEKCQPGLLCST